MKQMFLVFLIFLFPAVDENMVNDIYMTFIDCWGLGRVNVHNFTLF